MNRREFLKALVGITVAGATPHALTGLTKAAWDASDPKGTAGFHPSLSLHSVRLDIIKQAVEEWATGMPPGYTVEVVPPCLMRPDPDPGRGRAVNIEVLPVSIRWGPVLHAGVEMESIALVDAALLRLGEPESAASLVVNECRVHWEVVEQARRHMLGLPERILAEDIP